MGFVGAGGLGQRIDITISLFLEHQLLTLILAIYVMVTWWTCSAPTFAAGWSEKARTDLRRLDAQSAAAGVGGQRGALICITMFVIETPGGAGYGAAEAT